MTEQDEERQRRALLQYADENDTDVIAYIGQVSRPGYEKLCDVVPRKTHKNCLLVLATYGGDAHAGYRVARALSHHYPDPGTIRILVPTYCKSAGTLICIGAHELIIANQGELGPLDIQVQKPDEIFQLASGLDILRGLEYLQTSTLENFRSFLLEISQGSGLSTTISSEISTKLTSGIYNPILAQIDPLKLGEMQAALTIATDYGRRLNERTQNLRNDSLVRLSSCYPSHGFVIDRKEVKQLFEHVRSPDGEVELGLCEIASRIFDKMAYHNAIVVKDVLVEFAPRNSQANDQSDAKTGESNESDNRATALPANPKGPIPEECDSTGSRFANHRAANQGNQTPPSDGKSEDIAA